MRSLYIYVADLMRYESLGKVCVSKLIMLYEIILLLNQIVDYLMKQCICFATPEGDPYPMNTPPN